MEFYKYRVKGKIGTLGCKELKSISHVTHIGQAISIMKNFQIIPSLVYDHSKLNTDRILVNWFSPNEWTGYRYGTVRFTFDFENLVKKFSNLYWVETIEKYNPPACRLLFTNKDYTGNNKIKIYDITEKNGPIWIDFDSGKFYWNNYITLELMFEDSVKLNDCTIDFVNHHAELCNLKNLSCREKNISLKEVQALFLSCLISERIKITRFNFNIKSRENFIQIGQDRILNQFSNKNCKGTLKHNDMIAFSVAYSLLINYSKGHKKIAKNLSQLFESKKELRKCINSLFKEVLFEEETMQLKKEIKKLHVFPVFYYQKDIPSGIYIGTDRTFYIGSVYEKFRIVDKFENINEFNELLNQSENCNLYMVLPENDKINEILTLIKKEKSFKIDLK